VPDDEAGKRFQALGMFASALAGKAVAVMEGADADGPWTDGEAIYINPSASAQFTLRAIAVQASLIAAGSLGNPGASWHIMGMGDFNDDGLSVDRRSAGTPSKLALRL